MKQTNRIVWQFTWRIEASLWSPSAVQVVKALFQVITEVKPVMFEQWFDIHNMWNNKEDQTVGNTGKLKNDLLISLHNTQSTNNAIMTHRQFLSMISWEILISPERLHIHFIALFLDFIIFISQSADSYGLYSSSWEHEPACSIAIFLYFSNHFRLSFAKNDKILDIFIFLFSLHIPSFNRCPGATKLYLPQHDHY